MRKTVFAIAVLVFSTVAVAGNIPSGFDVFKTQPSSVYSFSENPIAADFFGPGSEPFEEHVYPVTFTKVWREKPAEFLDPAVPVTVETEIVSLQLHSTEPIRVTYATGQPDSFFDVFFDITVGETSGGAHTLTHNDVAAGEPDGGWMIDSFFDVFFEIEFTPVAGGETLSLQRFQHLTLIDPVPWSHTGPRLYDHGAPGGLLLGVESFAETLPDDYLPMLVRYQGSEFSWDFRLARIPEPATLTLLAVGAAALLRRRR